MNFGERERVCVRERVRERERERERELSVLPSKLMPGLCNLSVCALLTLGQLVIESGLDRDRFIAEESIFLQVELFLTSTSIEKLSQTQINY